MSDITLDDIASLAKRRGFIYQGSEIYGGLAGTWDYGPLGVALKRNIEQLWWKMFVDNRDDMYGVDTAILMNSKVWEASGHTGAGFADPLVEDLKTKKRYRADHLLEDNGVENPEAMTYEQMNQVIREKDIKSPDGNQLSEVRVFNMMFETYVGPIHDETGKSYLRPENAQGMFVNYKNVLDSFYPDLPFGLAQSGRVFRNEISPREFIFRVREFDLMEFEYFIRPDKWEEEFKKLHEQFYVWTDLLGLDRSKIHELEVPAEDRAHYSKRTIDFEYAFSFGTKEIGAIAYRTDFDLSNHMKHSGVNMEYTVKGSNEKFIPHVIEPTFGVSRMMLAALCEAYTVDELNGEKRVYLKLPKHLAPVKCAVSPLLKNKPELVNKAKEVYAMLQKELGNVIWDDNSNVGKRYRRSDEIGVPAHITIDFQTLEDNTVTIRNRDTAEQKRVTIAELTGALK
ncbi:MAG TPA: glycine--tRNA ligase [Candidatus Saccharimonadales bacterium]|nr:glycine--tRNA ligase [Candidatus Saccharimonadales bacterium]